MRATRKSARVNIRVKRFGRGSTGHSQESPLARVPEENPTEQEAQEIPELNSNTQKQTKTPTGAMKDFLYLDDTGFVEMKKHLLQFEVRYMRRRVRYTEDNTAAQTEVVVRRKQPTKDQDVTAAKKISCDSSYDSPEYMFVPEIRIFPTDDSDDEEMMVPILAMPNLSIELNGITYLSHNYKS